MVQVTIYGVVYVHFGSFEQLSLVGGLNRNFDTSHQGSPLWGGGIGGLPPYGFFPPCPPILNVIAHRRWANFSE